MNKTFIENLRQVRKNCGLTQKQVATKLNIVESCYANWEQGRTEPDITTIIKLCKIFEVTANDLFGF